MSDSVQKFYLDQESFGEKEKTEEEYSQDVINIRDLFRLLSLEDKVLVRRILSQENIF
jgi:hypothetical protein